MALQPPPKFPEQEWLSVLAAEAVARTTLLSELDAIGWQSAGHHHFLSWGSVKAAVARYVTALMGAFAEAACAAVRARRLQPIALDAYVEAFYELAIQQAYWGLDHQKIRATWRDTRISTPSHDLRTRVFASAWHAHYLAQIPDLLSAIGAPQPEDDAGQVRVKSGQRKSVLNTVLKSKGLSVPQWAEKAGVNQAVAYDYLNGKSEPRPANRKALAEALGLDAEDLPP